MKTCPYRDVAVIVRKWMLYAVQASLFAAAPCFLMHAWPRTFNRVLNKSFIYARMSLSKYIMHFHAISGGIYE